MQRELSCLPFFCGKRKVGKPKGFGAQKNGLPCEIAINTKGLVNTMDYFTGHFVGIKQLSFLTDL